MSVGPARSGKGYEARWREGGKQRMATFRTKRDAEEAERLGSDRDRGRRAGLPMDAGPITYDEIADRFLAQHQISARGLETLAYRLAHSRRAFGKVAVRELRTEEVARWAATFSPSSTNRRNALKVMRQVLGVAVDWGYLARNPAAPGLVRTPPAAPSQVRPFESWAEVDAVADAIDHAFTAHVLWACATGMRVQEWQALERRDADAEARVCRVARSVRGGDIVALGKTDSSLRTVVLRRRALDALAMRPVPIDGRGLLFGAPTGGIVDHANWRRRVWAPALKRAGLEYRPPSQCRHTYATLSLAAGAPIEWISKELGHASITTTLRYYARWLPAADGRVLAMLDAFDGRAQNAHSLSVAGSDPQ
jgi:integrase